VSSVVAIIPARYGSTRLPAKPLVDLCGKPMIQRVYERTSKASHVDKVIVATDHEEIVRVVKNFGGDVMMTPADLRSGTDRVAFVAKSLAEAEIVVNVQGDEPLIEPQMIDRTIEPLLKDRSITTGTPVKKITDGDDLLNPGIVKVVLDKDGFALYFSRSPIPFARDRGEPGQWVNQHTYYKHIGLYVFRKDFLLKYATWSETPLERMEKLEQLRILENGYRIKAVVTEFDSIPIDTQDDVDKVRAKLVEQKTND
jgi:3-deoxy-manno-octulosonate cytidylyltransferase (CMP-KDO synthetase)